MSILGVSRTFSLIFTIKEAAMAVTLSSPITGGAQTGFSAPTYTQVVDTAPDVNGRQVSVTALGGTQVGVTVGSVASPFTVTFVRPKSFKTLAPVVPNTGLLPSVPKNSWKAIIRKGVTPLAGQPASVMLIKIEVDVPAGADTADAPNIRAAMSAAIGALNQISAGFGDTLVSGVL
jgi:hypothetical protein